MEFLDAIDELQRNVEEIRKQRRRKRLRKLLRFFLIGFLIGRDSDKRISELTSRNNLIVDSLFKRLEDLKHEEKRIKELSDMYIQLTRITEMMTKLKRNRQMQRTLFLT
ncbi:MAG TPA: hypothetical protein VJ249_03895 [Candidatus Bathyarchaeia archaeon]|nr:hypothetical protein [Candidatus Bathyarchaeia archaeon]